MNEARIIDYLYIESEDVNHGSTVIELISNLKLYDQDKQVYMYNVNEDSLFGVSSNEFTSKDDTDDNLLIGAVECNRTSKVGDLIRSLIDTIKSDVYDNFGNCYQIDNDSEVYLSKYSSDGYRLIGVSDSEGFPIIITR